MGRVGFSSTGGRFVREQVDGSTVWGDDRTIASIVAAIHTSLGYERFNRFFSYSDEVKNQELYELSHRGFTPVWTKAPDGRAVQRAMSGKLLPERQFKWTSEGPQPV